MKNRHMRTLLENEMTCSGRTEDSLSSYLAQEGYEEIRIGEKKGRIFMCTKLLVGNKRQEEGRRMRARARLFADKRRLFRTRGCAGGS